MIVPLGRTSIYPDPPKYPKERPTHSGSKGHGFGYFGGLGTFFSKGSLNSPEPRTATVPQKEHNRAL